MYGACSTSGIENKGCIESNEEKRKVWYSGGSEKINEVGVAMKAKPADTVVEVRRYDENLIRIKVGVCKKI